MERRLAAILAADVVGYSRLMGADEAGTLAAVKALRRELFEPAVATHNGRLFKLMGDGALVEFASVVDATNCAVAVQQANAKRIAAATQAARIDLRIAVNLGDVIIEGRDVYGDGVNVAARLQELAEPGGVVLSATAHEHAAPKVRFAFADGGAHALKNIANAVRIYRWQGDEPDAGTAAVSHDTLGLTARPSIAVLPFANLSGDPAQEYFSDGLAEDIITGLALWRSFPVIASNSSFAYKGRAADVRAIGAELGARYVLEGSVRRSGERARVTAQLLDAETGHHLWADRFDREMRDIFALQDEITERIVAAIAPEVLRAEEQRANQKRPTDLTGWDLILRAMSAKAVGHGYGTEEGNVQAKRYLDEAIAREPSADAWAWRALCDWHDAIQGWVDDTGAALERSMAAARQSIDKDDANWLAHMVLGIALLFGRGQTDSAVEEASQAVRLNPSSSQAQHTLGCALDFAGDQAQALHHLEAVFRLDPLYRSRAAAYGDLALTNLLCGDTEAAVSWGRKAVDHDPNYVRGRQRLVAALSAAGNAEEAQAELASVLDQQPGFSLDYVRRTYPFADPAQAERFVACLRDAGAT